MSIFQVKCFSCNEIIGHKWEEYNILLEKYKDDDIIKNGKEYNEKFDLRYCFEENFNDFFKGPKYRALQKLNIQKSCCRTLFLTTVECNECVK